MHFPIEASILKKACIFHKIQQQCYNTSRRWMQFPIEAAILKRAYILQNECCNTSRNITISNEEVCSKKNISLKKTILCQTVVHWHCWHGASSTNASCHLANTSGYLANLYVYIKRKRKPKKKNTLLRVIPTVTFIDLLLANLLAFYLTYLLAFDLAFYLAYLLTFYLAYLLAFYLANLLAFSLAYLLAFYGLSVFSM